MTQYRVAAPEKPKIRPAFIVQPLEGKRIREIIHFDVKTGKRKNETIEEPAGYLVTMANGNSIRVRNDAEMARLGFDQSISLVNEDGEVVGEIDNYAMRKVISDDIAA